MQLLKNCFSAWLRDNDSCTPRDAPFIAGELETTRGERFQFRVTLVWPPLLNVLEDSAQLPIPSGPNPNVVCRHWGFLQVLCQKHQLWLFGCLLRSLRQWQATKSVGIGMCCGISEDQPILVV